MNDEGVPMIGADVHYRRQEGGPCQAAIIVKVWSSETVNLVVFRDGSNDRGVDGYVDELTYLATSVALSQENGWHWPEEPA